ncbi:MAG: phosphoribosylformylglycinamidine synthase subunit PurQ [Desulfovibrionaceae bacterium]|nr:phosphoribosylformylglycinamidine synthase subunit PurQ [Desulfovibrionaceae bacterium]
MPRVKTIVITGFGTNCEVESAFAATQAGSDVTDIAYFSDVTAGRTRLADYNLLIFPGGFLDGDDLGAAQAAALRWTHAKTRTGEAVIDQLKAFFEAGGLILGICNGFQLLVKIGLLPGLFGRYFVRELSLSNNDSGRFEDRWVTLAANPACPCVFTRGVSRIDLPVRHGEGKLIPNNQAVLDALWAENLVALQYADPATGLPTENYPENPNGSPMGIAGLTDPTGRILGLMPHPEAFNHPTNHPGWTRGETSVLGTVLLENGVAYLKSST